MLMRRLRGRLPTFIVVGGSKCGTSSLHYYLSLHPEVWMSRPKELFFFSGSDQRASTGRRRGNWWRGEDWYRSHFRTVRRACGEATPSYVNHVRSPHAAERMRRLIPDVRLVQLVRDPMARLRSHYLMARRDPHLPPISFAEFVQSGRFADYVARSDYGTGMARLLEHFPREQLLVLESADLDRDRARTLSRLFAFIGVDPTFQSDAFATRIYESQGRRFPSPTGARILNSSVMRACKRALPFTAYQALKNTVLVPFSIPKPDLTLPPEVEQALRERFRAEADLARKLSGLPLASLGA